MITHRYAGNYVPWIVRAILTLLSLLPTATAGANPGDQIRTLTASDGSHRDGFGLSMAVSGNVALIGATDNSYPTQNYGSAYLFDVTTGQQLRKLTPTDPFAGNRFGYSVALDGNIALIGAIKDPDPGAAYFFEVSTGQQLAAINAFDGRSGDFFGSAVALSGNRAIVGASRGGPCITFRCANNPGAAYIFDVATGQQLFKLTASDPFPSDNFGSSVAISGDKAVVGAWGNIQQGAHGAAYVFDVNTGQQLYKLTAPPHPGDFFDLDFGFSVALSGKVALIGARRGFDKNTGYSGSAYLFDVATGQQLLQVKASDLHQNDGFGRSVALNESVVLVGAVGATPFSQNLSGKAYLFDRTTGQQLAKLENAECYGDCGYSVALNGDTALISTPFFYDQGRVYVFSAAPEPAGLSLTACAFAAVGTLVRKRHRCA